MDRMESYLDQKNQDKECATSFKVALHILDWVLEKEYAGDFSAIADEIVTLAKGRVRKRIAAKLTVSQDHFAI